jgi:hypothetical protein
MYYSEAILLPEARNEYPTLSNVAEISFSVRLVHCGFPALPVWTLRLREGFMLGNNAAVAYTLALQSCSKV